MKKHSIFTYVTFAFLLLASSPLVAMQQHPEGHRGVLASLEREPGVLLNKFMKRYNNLTPKRKQMLNKFMERYDNLTPEQEKQLGTQLIKKVAEPDGLIYPVIGEQTAHLLFWGLGFYLGLAIFIALELVI